MKIEMNVDNILKDENFFSIVKDILGSDKFESTKQHIHHYNTSTFDHSVRVAYLFFLRQKVINNDLVRSALLHDYYLYDWHASKRKVHRKGLHGFTHPKLAAENATRDFGISKAGYKMIYKHMFPLTLFRIPTTKAEWLLVQCDKLITLKEYLSKKRKKYIRSPH